MLREDLQKALKESMINKDTATVSAVRLIIAGLKEKDVDARGRGQKEATDAELLSMMQNNIRLPHSPKVLFSKPIYQPHFRSSWPPL